MFRILATVLAFSIAGIQPSWAQTNQRTQFNEGLARFNELVTERSLGDAIASIHPEGKFSEEEISDLNEELMISYSTDFSGSATVRSETLKSGFRQELLAYWTADGDYFYVYMLIHSRENRRMILDVKYDHDLHHLMDLF